MNYSVCLFFFIINIISPWVNWVCNSEQIYNLLPIHMHVKFQAHPAFPISNQKTPISSLLLKAKEDTCHKSYSSQYPTCQASRNVLSAVSMLPCTSAAIRLPDQCLLLPGQINPVAFAFNMISVVRIIVTVIKNISFEKQSV